MVPLHKLPAFDRSPAMPLAPAQQITVQQRGLLNHLRMAAMGCRTAARTDLFEACALLTIDGEDAKRTFVETFVKCLPDAAQSQIKWFSPGVVQMSFDEAWVMRCLSCIADDNTDNLNFLLKSRIAVSDRRYIGFLLGRISEQFTQV